MSEEWYTVCDEKELLLKKNDNNEYSLALVVKDDDVSILDDVINTGQLFELLYELNKDIIENIIESKENNINEINNVSIKIKNIKNEFKTIKNINIHLKFKYTIVNNSCTINSLPFDNNFKSNEENIYISHFQINFEKNEKTNILLKFKIDDEVDNDLYQMYIGLYFKKLFYRFKMYFE
jgi:ribosome-associated toxin RatA of RatAB toxin-antitoxin module